LTEAVKQAERRYVVDVWLWTRSKSTGDICPLVAVTIAKWAANQAVKSRPVVAMILGGDS
jgi:hypothetical protein